MSIRIFSLAFIINSLSFPLITIFVPWTPFSLKGYDPKLNSLNFLTIFSSSKAISPSPLFRLTDSDHVGDPFLRFGKIVFNID